MKNGRHKLSIGIERDDNNFFLSIKAVGKLTHADYQLMAPPIESALGEVKETHVKALVDATEWDGWELRAAWDDFKLGLKHGNQFDKIAIYGDESPHETLAKIGSWFISGEIKYFPNQLDAVVWLMS